jgi:hypothetical protein
LEYEKDGWYLPNEIYYAPVLVFVGEGIQTIEWASHDDWGLAGRQARVRCDA